MDNDADGWWVGCDAYPPDAPTDDCDDNDYNNHDPMGCANCVDADMDGFWVGCDIYDNVKPGPDCDDGNPNVGQDNATEICNGLSESCSGEIDFLPADEMCPPGNMNPPNVNPFDGWICDPPAPGQDGCQIKTCLEQFFDIDKDYTNGCECEGTSRNFSLAECSEDMPGFLGSVDEGDELFGEDLPIGVIPAIDNGKGLGAEDWYWVNFPENNADLPRPNAGSVQVDFTVNENSDYRFEVYRTCAAGAWANGIGTVCTPDPNGNGLEWWFNDSNQMMTNPMYNNMVMWPGKVFIRVFRVQNPNSCTQYRLRVRRLNT